MVELKVLTLIFLVVFGIPNQIIDYKHRKRYESGHAWGYCAKLSKEGGEVAGCIDAGRVGIADRYQDLAIVLNCLAEFDAALQERFLKQHGIYEPDQDKLHFHLLLDELF